MIILIPSIEEIIEKWKIDEGKERKMTMGKQYFSYVQSEVITVLKKRLSNSTTFEELMLVTQKGKNAWELLFVL